MMMYNNETEQRILDSARKLFITKGYHATTTEDIANEANVNRTSLHYYFRSKDKLFELIFTEVLTQITKNLLKILSSNILFENKIRQIISAYIDILLQHPYFPDFVIHELTINPERMEKIVKKHNHFFRSFLKFQVEIRKELKLKNRTDINPFEFTLNIASLCIFPFLSEPIITRISKSFGETEFIALMKKRKSDIADLVINSLEVRT